MTSMQQYFIGLPISEYEDFKTIIDRILSGSMMKDPRVDFQGITDIDSNDESTPFSMNETDRKTPAGGRSNELKIAELLDIIQVLKTNRMPGDEIEIELLTMQLQQQLD